MLLLQFFSINFFFRLLDRTLVDCMLLRYVAWRPCNNVIIFEYLMHLIMAFAESVGILDID